MTTKFDYLTKIDPLKAFVSTVLIASTPLILYSMGIVGFFTSEQIYNFKKKRSQKYEISNFNYKNKDISFTQSSIQKKPMKFYIPSPNLENELVVKDQKTGTQVNYLDKERNDLKVDEIIINGKSYLRGNSIYKDLFKEGQELFDFYLEKIDSTKKVMQYENEQRMGKSIEDKVNQAINQLQ